MTMQRVTICRLLHLARQAGMATGGLQSESGTLPSQ